MRPLPLQLIASQREANSRLVHQHLLVESKWVRVIETVALIPYEKSLPTVSPSASLQPSQLATLDSISRGARYYGVWKPVKPQGGGSLFSLNVTAEPPLVLVLDVATRCTCACMHMHTHAHAHRCTHTSTHMHTRAHVHVDMHIHAHRHAHTCPHTCTHAHMHTCTHAHMHIHAHMQSCSHAVMHTCTHAHMHTHVTRSLRLFDKETQLLELLLADVTINTGFRSSSQWPSPPSHHAAGSHAAGSHAAAAGSAAQARNPNGDVPSPDCCFCLSGSSGSTGVHMPLNVDIASELADLLAAVAAARASVPLLPPPALHTGVLLRERGALSTWSEVWSVLLPCKLLLYSNEAAIAPRRVIPLSKGVSVIRRPGSLMLTLRTPKWEVKLAAKDVTACAAWLGAISHALPHAPPTNPDPAPDAIQPATRGVGESFARLSTLLLEVLLPNMATAPARGVPLPNMATAPARGMPLPNMATASARGVPLPNMATLICGMRPRVPQLS